MDRETPSPPEEREEDNLVKFPTSEYMAARQRHPAGKLARKPVQETLRELGMIREADEDT